MTNETPPVAGSVTDLLNTGSEALRFFELFEPPYLKWVGDKNPGYKSYGELHALYYQQNGLNEDSFGNAASTLQEVLGRVEDHHGQLRQRAQNLPSVWSGQAAANALDMVSGQLSMAEADKAVVKNVHAELSDSVSELRAAVSLKSALVGAILEDGNMTILEGKSPEDVYTVIEGAEHLGVTHAWGSAMQNLERIFPDMYTNVSAPRGFLNDAVQWVSLGFIGPGSPTTHSIETFCKDWLVEFAAEYERLIGVFVTACTETDRLVREEYDRIVAAFRGLSEEPYPCPRGTPQPTTPQTTTGAPVTTGAPTTTSGAPSTTTAPSPATTPSTTTTAPGENPLAGLTQLGTQLASSGLGTQLAQGVSQLVSSAAEQVGNTLEQLRADAEQQIDADGDGQPDNPAEDPEDPGKADEGDKGIELDGKEYKLELGPDGRLQLVVTGQEGEPQTYRVEIGADGKPVIVEAGAGEEQEAGSSDSGEGQPAGQPPAPPTGKKEEDTEHQPQNYPARPEADNEDEHEAPQAPPGHTPQDGEQQDGEVPPTPPVDTGAQLAEAGPL